MAHGPIRALFRIWLAEPGGLTSGGAGRGSKLLVAVSVVAVATVAAVIFLGPRASSSPGATSTAPALAARPFGARLGEDERRKVLHAYEKLPLAFAPNAGQASSRVGYHAQGPGFSFNFTAHKVVLAFARDKTGAGASAVSGRGATERDRETSTQVLELRFLGGAAGAGPEARRKTAATVNYLNGDDKAKWRRRLPTYQQVVYQNLWPGIDMVFRGSGATLTYEFIIRPGARVDDIALAYAGAQGLSLTPARGLAIDTRLGTVRESRPVSYQRIDGRRVPVSSRFVLRRAGGAQRRFGFAVGAHDASRPLVIDPTLDYSTYLGGSNIDQGLDVAVDPSGNAYVTGVTFSLDFPTKNAFQPANAGGLDAFVTKLDASGSALVYSTYLGGTANDGGNGIAVDSLGNAYVTGATESPNFPTKNAVQPAPGGGQNDAFVTKLDPSGSALVYSTYLGASDSDNGTGIAVEPRGNSARAYVVGQTRSPNFPTKNAFQTVFKGLSDAFVTKFDDGGSALVYSTYLGGSGFDALNGADIAVHPSGVDAGLAYVTGDTDSPDFPTMNAFQPANAGGFDAFATKIDPSGSALVYSTYLGGSGPDFGEGVAVDPPGEAQLTGATGSPNFPTKNAFQPANAGGLDAYVTKLDRSGTTLVYSTYLGGTLDDFGFDVALDPPGNAYVTGNTLSPNFPTANAIQPANAGGVDVFVTKIDRSGTTLAYSTYLGGSALDVGFGIAVHPPGDAYVTGFTDSPNFPTKTAFQPANAGGSDAFVTKIGR